MKNKESKKPDPTTNYLNVYVLFKTIHMPTITTRVPKPMLKQIDEFSKQKHMDRSTILRNLLARGLEQENKEHVLSLYKQHKITLQKLASLLDITYIDALELLHQEGLQLDYGKEELQEDLSGLR